MAVTDEIACKQGCGKTFTTEGWRVKHELKCQGKPRTRGRIERLAARHGALVPVSEPPTRSQKRNRRSDRPPPAASGFAVIQGAATDKAIEVVIAGLTAKRDAIDGAIAALQAVSA